MTGILTKNGSLDTETQKHTQERPCGGTQGKDDHVTGVMLL